MFQFVLQLLDSLGILSELGLLASHEIVIIEINFLVLHWKLCADLISKILMLVDVGGIECVPEEFIFFIVFGTDNCI